MSFRRSILTYMVALAVGASVIHAQSVIVENDTANPLSYWPYDTTAAYWVVPQGYPDAIPVGGQATFNYTAGDLDALSIRFYWYADSVNFYVGVGDSVTLPTELDYMPLYIDVQSETSAVISYVDPRVASPTPTPTPTPTGSGSAPSKVVVTNPPAGAEFILAMLAFLCGAVLWRMWVGRW